MVYLWTKTYVHHLYIFTDSRLDGINGWSNKPSSRASKSASCQQIIMDLVCTKIMVGWNRHIHLERRKMCTRRFLQSLGQTTMLVMEQLATCSGELRRSDSRSSSGTSHLHPSADLLRFRSCGDPAVRNYCPNS
jgi:hypothetical protein